MNQPKTQSTTGERAQPESIICKDCRGGGTWGGKTCPYCHGSGRVKTLEARQAERQTEKDKALEVVKDCEKATGIDLASGWCPNDLVDRIATAISEARAEEQRNFINNVAAVLEADDVEMFTALIMKARQSLDLNRETGSALRSESEIRAKVWKEAIEMARKLGLCCDRCPHGGEPNADGSCPAYGYNGVDCQSQPCVCRAHNTKRQRYSALIAALKSANEGVK